MHLGSLFQLALIASHTFVMRVFTYTDKKKIPPPPPTSNLFSSVPTQWHPLQVCKEEEEEEEEKIF